MTQRGFIVAGTDTGIGKTVFAAALTAAIGADYWKPVQAGLDEAGLDGETDSQTVARLAGLPPARIWPEAYRLRLPVSPHLSAAVEGLSIERERLALPTTQRPLVVEAAGGVLVPLTPALLQIEMFAEWGQSGGLPVIVCARTTLGTINHTLLTLEALRHREIEVHGVAFIGDACDQVELSIAEIGRVCRLGRLPWLESLTAASLRAAFADGFQLGDEAPLRS